MVGVDSMQSAGRVITWFSNGASSAVLAKYFHCDEIVMCETNSEHVDNIRFKANCERWFGRKIVVLRNERYSNIDEIFEKRKFLRSPNGALCTTEMKIKLRLAYSDTDDISQMGYTIEEVDRADKLQRNFPEYQFKFPLIENRIMKADCLAMIKAAGIELPWMYRNGYSHNNCLGCVKSGSKRYWLMIKRDFPEVFWRRARQERELGYCLIKGVYLDELTGDVAAAPDNDDHIQCDMYCQSVLLQMER